LGSTAALLSHRRCYRRESRRLRALHELLQLALVKEHLLMSRLPGRKGSMLQGTVISALRCSILG
jgi:hypothetical protein